MAARNEYVLHISPEMDLLRFYASVAVDVCYPRNEWDVPFGAHDEVPLDGDEPLLKGIIYLDGHLQVVGVHAKDERFYWP